MISKALVIDLSWKKHISVMTFILILIFEIHYFDVIVFSVINSYQLCYFDMCVDIVYLRKSSLTHRPNEEFGL